VPSPWGPRQPDPFFDRTAQVFALALAPGERFPFLPPDEVFLAAEAARKEKEKQESKEKKEKRDAADEPEKQKPEKPEPGDAPLPETRVVLDGIASRQYETPVPPGNYEDLTVLDERLLLRSVERVPKAKPSLVWAPISHDKMKLTTLVEDCSAYEVSLNRKAVLARRGEEVLVFDASLKDLGGDAGKEAVVDLAGWTFPVVPAEEWRQVFLEAWRLQRDFFYDPGMHGADWPAMRERYLPLVERVTNRDELADLIGQMLSEVRALHTNVFGGDRRQGDEQVEVATLGALLEPAEDGSGWRISHVYRGDPDDPSEASPLARPDLGVAEGDVLVALNGVPLTDGRDPAPLLQGQGGRQVLLSVRAAAGGDPRPIVVTALPPREDRDLRHSDWEEGRRAEVERLGAGRLGYVHLRAMGARDIADWARQFYPVYDREGLVIDVRGNRGGNIDSWILGKLLRRAWSYWQPRTGKPYWNMQYAFRGHMVVLVDENTASDGECFAEGFRRLGLGKVIGVRTWGGEIWLSTRDWLVDKGYASAAQTGLYSPEGTWLIEGRGVEPDLVVENLPHATYRGEDAQLRAAVEHLLERAREEPVTVPRAPPHPVKAR
jgi:tricorn protease